ncbi:MAG: ATP-binding cassette domain-containing protein, partial [Bdellovibrionota bacterium]
AKRERTLAKVDRSEKILNQEKRNHRGKKAAEKGGLPKILIGRRKRQAQFTTARVDVETMENNIKAVGKAHEALKEIKAEPVMFAHIRGEQIPHQKLVAEAAGFNLRFETWVFEKDLTFHWRGPVRVALNGRNGAGKSTLLKALMKTPPNEVRGTLRRGTINTLYIDQRCSLLTETRTVFENVRMHSQLSEPEIRNHLSKFLFTANTVFQTISNLSGGERLRAALAVGFLSNEMPELIILDEPTNNLDLANIEFLENLLREFKGALIVVSHDDAFLRNCGIVSEIEI